MYICWIGGWDVWIDDVQSVSHIITMAVKRVSHFFKLATFLNQNKLAKHNSAEMLLSLHHIAFVLQNLDRDFQNQTFPYCYWLVLGHLEMSPLAQSSRSIFFFCHIKHIWTLNCTSLEILPPQNLLFTNWNAPFHIIDYYTQLHSVPLLYHHCYDFIVSTKTYATITWFSKSYTRPWWDVNVQSVLEMLTNIPVNIQSDVILLLFLIVNVPVLT